MGFNSHQALNKKLIDSWGQPEITNAFAAKITGEDKMAEKQTISTSNIPEFKTGSTLTADMFNNIITILEHVAAKHGKPIQTQKRYSTGSTLTASDMNDLVENINQIYEHIGQHVPDWSFDRFKTGGKLRASDLNEIVRTLNTLESIDSL